MYNNNQRGSYSGPPHNNYPPPPGSSSSRYVYSYPPPPTSNYPPPPPSRYDSYQPRDHYQPDQGYRGPYSDLRHSSNQSYRDPRDDFHPPQGDFSFRSQAPGGIDFQSGPPQQYDSYTPYQNARRQNFDRRAPNDNRSHHRSQRGGHGGGRVGQNNRPKPHYNHRENQTKPSERPLMTQKFDQKAETMLGDVTKRATYRDVDDLSDSDETDMDISDSGEANNNNSGAGEPSSKRVKTDASELEAQAVPKWSNPDPYTALPLPDTTTRKKDFVQLIRKARVDPEVKKESATASEAADFISCELSDEETPTTATTTTTMNPGNQLPAHVPAAPRSMLSSTTGAPAGLDASQPTSSGHDNALLPDLNPSTSLGSRKRTIDDELKPHAPLKKVNRMASTGQLLWDWKLLPGEEPCPWAVLDHSLNTGNWATRLHKELVDFYEFVRPRDFEEKVRKQLIASLDRAVKGRFRDAELLPFGSFMSGLYLPTGDMDIAICSQSLIRDSVPKYNAKKSLWQFKNYFQSLDIAFQNNIDPVAKAKVPLLKYTDDHTGLKVDISFEKMDGHNAIGTFLAWKKKYPAMPPLVAFIKQFLLMRGLNEPVNGGIGGFTVICMVVHILQTWPAAQSGAVKPEDHLGDVLTRFLDYYGNHFEYQMSAIRMYPPYLVKKNLTAIVYRDRDRLSIVDPNDAANDVSGGSSNFPAIKRCFAQALATLIERKKQLEQSNFGSKATSSADTLLYPLVGGNYSSFRRQREWLDKASKQPPRVHRPLRNKNQQNQR